MSKVIVKSPYLKTGAGGGGYLRYIATREGAEPVTGYLRYIADRPRSHGLFGDADDIDLTKAAGELQVCRTRVWTHIFSLKREDASRLGYDNADAWQNLLRAHRNEIAAAMHIRPNDFRWYAAFHNEGEHPHVHMMAWSSCGEAGYLSQNGIWEIRSMLTNEIFKQELLELYTEKGASRDEFVREARRAMAELTQKMEKNVCGDTEIEKKMIELSRRLEMTGDKKQCGYLPKDAKLLVDEIVDRMAQLPDVATCYERWQEMQKAVRAYYSSKPQERLPLSQQKEFCAVKNAVVREAESLRRGVLRFEDNGVDDEPETQSEDSDNRYYCVRSVIFSRTATLDKLDEAVNEMHSLAESGAARAQFMLGKMYRDRIGVLPNAVEAKRWFSLAAEQDDGLAQYALGKLCLSDDAEVRDIEAGLYWLQRAAANGSEWANYRLGKEYLRGELIPQNKQTAEAYLTAAAEKGTVCAQYALGKLCFSDGDKARATYWLSRSAANGNVYAQFLLDRIESPRPPDVLLSATRLLSALAQIFRDNSAPPATPSGLRMDSKRRQKLRQKRMALGHKADDHEDYVDPKLTM